MRERCCCGAEIEVPQEALDGETLRKTRWQFVAAHDRQVASAHDRYRAWQRDHRKCTVAWRESLPVPPSGSQTGAK